jgi:uncharacterized repeat protein (TIGR02543 family)
MKLNSTQLNSTQLNSTQLNSTQHLLVVTFLLFSLFLGSAGMLFADAFFGGGRIGAGRFGGIAPAAPTYTVTYNGNGNTSGTVPTDAGTYINGATVTVLGNTGTLARTSYTFSDWNTSADGGGTNRAAASTFPMGSANVTLYAKWTAAGAVCGNGVLEGAEQCDSDLTNQCTAPGTENFYRGGFVTENCEGSACKNDCSECILTRFCVEDL